LFLQPAASLETLRSTLRAEIKKVPESTSMSGGNVYTRWGRTSCPSDDTETVYTGVIGGGHFTHSGSASNYLCLPNDPQWDETGLTASTVDFIYGTEYETTTSSSFKHLHDREAPCAVCKAPIRNVIMIPARTTCYRGWRLEYSGYVMTGHHSHAGNKNAICVDASPEVVPGSSSADHNGALLYFVKVQCGALKCPPYVDSKILTCVVCSK